jgi:DNA-binding beta-propeller fold protein YncE
VLDGQTDSLLEVISLPSGPSRMSYAETAGRLFVSCMNDLVSWNGDPTKRGSVIVIDVNSLQVEQVIYAGFQPYAITADDEQGVLVVANRNTDITGPVPHHVSYCEGRNGYVTLIDLNTLEVIPDFKVEILADPSTIAHR